MYEFLVGHTLAHKNDPQPLGGGLVLVCRVPLKLQETRLLSYRLASPVAWPPTYLAPFLSLGTPEN